MGKLNRELVYLSGSMQFAPDGGVKWRQIMKEKLKPLGIRSIDPTDKPCAGADNDYREDTKIMDQLMAEKRWDDLCKYVKRFRRADLRYTDLAGFIIVYLNPKIPTFGTMDELLVAEKQHKPRFIIVEGGIENLPIWLFSIFKPHEIFPTLDDCVDHIKKLDSGEIPLDDRWVLIREPLHEEYKDEQINLED